MKQTRRDDRNRVLRVGESQRKDGRYAFKYTDGTGRVRFAYSWRLVETDRLPKGKRACAPLREKERSILRDLEDGIDHQGARMTVARLYERYVDCHGNVKPTTARGRERLAALLRKDPLGGKAIGSVKPSDARGWARRMSAEGYAFTTISNYKRSLKAAFYDAVRDDLVRKNPFDFKVSEVIEVDTVAKEPLSREQAEALLGFLETDAVYRRYHDDVVILLGTGLRVSELCGLTRDDIDLTARIIRIDHQLLPAEGGGYRVAAPKTERGVRSIHMSEAVAGAFRRVLARSDGKDGIEVDGLRGFLFTNRNGNPRTGRDYARVFQGIVRKYGKDGTRPPLPEVVTPHTMRHTFCTDMAMRGMNPKALQYVMGHADITMTLGYYAHAGAETAMDEMERVVG